ncbi:MAG: GntR family transcriptional regulator [Chloroflexota bacterium]|nr:MAG: GntR family transcriptional regulator [Chloroflexota bacterium]
MSEALHHPADVPHRTVTEQVLAELRRMILGGALVPGSRIDQAELAQRFGVSVVPVREALARLQSSGLVRIVPRRGVFVEALSAEELVDIYNVRELLEEHAARLAGPNLTDDDILAMEGLVERMEAAAAEQDYDTYLALNREFHFTIYRAARRPYLLQVISQLWDRSMRYRRLQLHAIPDRTHDAIFEFRAIIAACRRRDIDAMGYLVRYKVHQTTVGLLEQMQAASASAASVNGREQQA